MDYIVGIVGDGFVLLAADMSQAHSVLIVKSDADKMLQVADRCLLAFAGEVGDRSHFGELVKGEMRLRSIRTGLEMTTAASANFVRRLLADSLRSRNSYHVNLLMAGADSTGPSLYFLDYLGSLVKVPFGAHGYGAIFTLSVLDRWYKPNMQLVEAKELLRKCLAEVKTRFMMNLGNFKVRMVNSTGIHEIDVPL